MKNIKFWILIAFLAPINIYVNADIDPEKNPDYIPVVIPPSPTAAALGQYGQVPVGMFTGTPQVSIPLYTLKSKYLSVPLSLSYSSNGVKVDQVASWVGLGWSLNAGGVITRTVRGQEDENFSYPVPENMDEYCYETWEFLNFVWDDLMDTEPDMFSFNFNGYSGKFVIYDDQDGNYSVATIPYQNLKIHIGITDGGIDTILVTTPNGIKYCFGGDYIETAKVFNNGYECSRSFSKEKNTAWYLYKIEHPQGDIIEFEYESNIFTYRSGISETIRKLVNLSSGCGTGDECSPGQEAPSQCIQILRSKTWHLSNITTLYGKYAIFEASDNRLDLSDFKLDAFVINNPDSNLFKRFELDYHFTTHNNFTNSIHTADQTLKQRMFLTSLSIEDPNQSEVEQYAFDYIDYEALAPRLSFAQDHWGYFNGANNNVFLPDPGEGWSFYFNETYADREANGLFSDKGLLEKVTYPTGGYTLLEYEPHSYPVEVTIYPDPQYLSCYSTGNDYYQYNDVVCGFSVLEGQTADVSGFMTYDGGLDPECNNPQNDYKGRVIIRETVTQDIIFSHYLTESNDEFNDAIPLEGGMDYELVVGAAGKCTRVGGHLSYYNGEAYQTIVNQETGGQRIAKTTIYDNLSDQSEIVKYQYNVLSETDISSGVIEADALFVQNSIIRMQCLHPCDYHDCEYVTLYSASVNTLYNSTGNHIYYPYVTKFFGDDGIGGAEQFEYSVSHDQYGRSLISSNYILGSTKVNKAWNSGNLLKHNIYKKKPDGSWTIVNKTVNTYLEDSRNETILTGHAIRKNIEQVCFTPWWVECTDELRDNPLRYQCTAYQQHCINGDSAHKYRMYDGSGFCRADDAVNIPVWHPCHETSADSVETDPSLDHFDVMEYEILSKWQYIESTEVKEYDENGQNPVITTTQYFYDNPEHAQLTKSVTTDSKGQTVEQEYYYPGDYGNIGNFNTLIVQHMIGLPIDVRTSVDDKLISGTVTGYNLRGQPIEVFVAEDELGTDLPFDNLNPTYGTKKIDLKYDGFNNLYSYLLIDNNPVSYCWGYDDQYPICKTENASVQEMSFTSFEDKKCSDWQNTAPIIFEPDAKSGKKVAKLSASMNNGSGISKSFPLTGLSEPVSGYMASVWVKSVSTDAFIHIEIENIWSTNQRVYCSGSNEWELLQVSIPRDVVQDYVNGSNSIKVYIKNTGGDDAWFDDLRVHPSDAFMTTYTYDPMLGVTSESDINNLTKTYEYDNYGRLYLIRDHNGDILQRFTYHFASEN